MLIEAVIWCTKRCFYLVSNSRQDALNIMISQWEHMVVKVFRDYELIILKYSELIIIKRLKSCCERENTFSASAADST